MSRFCSLFSSSSGNCTYIGTASRGVLVDAGVSAKRIKKALTDRELDPESIGAIFVTHGHSDHINGIRVFASAHHIPVYATAGTVSELESAGCLNGKFGCEVMPTEGIDIGGIFVESFATPHDSAESCGYCFRLPDGRRAAVATDIGHMTNEIMNALTGCDLVLLESNHDVGMLQNGPYPYYLKRRILSDVGHLSNEACADAVSQLIGRGTTRFFLGHLSTENNLPELAWQTSYAALYEIGATLDKDYMLEVNSKENLEGIVRF